MASRPLTTKQQLFVEHYLANPNASDAALKAGYSPKTAAFIGAENLKKPKIAEALSSRVDNAVMSANAVLEELSDIAKADWREFLKITYDKDGNEREALLQLKDKIKALELVGRFHKLFTDRHEVSLDVRSLTDEELEALAQAKG